MRRFILTYQREGQAIETFEGVQFSSGKVLLESHPFGGIALFRCMSHLERELNEFGEASIKWIDAEVNSVQS